MTLSEAMELLCTIVEAALPDADVLRYYTTTENLEEQQALFTDKTATGVYHLWQLKRMKAEGIGDIGQQRHRDNNFKFFVVKAVGADVNASQLAFEESLDTAMDALDTGWPVDNSLHMLEMCKTENHGFIPWANLRCHYCEVDVILEKHLS